MKYRLAAFAIALLSNELDAEMQPQRTIPRRLVRSRSVVDQPVPMQRAVLQPKRPHEVDSGPLDRHGPARRRQLVPGAMVALLGLRYSLRIHVRAADSVVDGDGRDAAWDTARACAAVRLRRDLL